MNINSIASLDSSGKALAPSENLASSTPKGLAGSPSAPQQPKQSSITSRETVEAAVKQLNNFVVNHKSELSFSIDEKSGIRVVKVVDSTTDQVIRQFPSEEAIQVAQALDKLQGLLLREKA